MSDLSFLALFGALALSVVFGFIAVVAGNGAE